MTIDKFLSFWSHNNTLIIEGLVALIILLSLFVAYRGFFGKKEDGHSEAGGGLDAAQLEKTLQKILENQGKAGVSHDTHAADDHHAAPAAASGASPEAAEEIAQLKAAVADGRKKADTLQAQLKAAEEKAAAGGGAAAPAAEGLSEKEKEDFASKIRDLEARLAEYEIISEDIADLSRYREENDDLRKEIESMKAGGAVPAAAAAPAAQATPAPEPIAVTPEPTPVKEDALEVEAAPAPAAPELEVAVAEAAPAEASSELIDDELMREFAAAVEGQQNKTLEKAAEKAGDGTTEAKDMGDDAAKLMNEFEDFVTKKS